MKNNLPQSGVAMRISLISFLLLPYFAQGEAFACIHNGQASYQAIPCAPGGALLPPQAHPEPFQIASATGTANEAEGGAMISESSMPSSNHESAHTQASCEDAQVPQFCRQQNLQAELSHAIDQGQTTEVYRLLKQMKDVHYLSPATSPSPFVTAIEKGHVKIVKALLDKGADPLARDAQGVSMLAAAIERAQAKSPGISRAMYQCLSLALDRAAAKGLLKPDFPLNATLAFSHKPDPVLLRYLLKYGADPGAKFEYGMTAIEMAFNQKQTNMLKIMLNTKPRVPLSILDKLAYRAYFDKKPEMRSVLRAAGGNPVRYAKNDPQALFDALQPDRTLEELAFVLKSGANPNAPLNPQSQITPLSMAVPYPDKLLMLIKHGADVNAKGPAGTVLVNILFRSGLNIYAAPGQTMAPYPSLAIARFLLGSGAKVNGNLGGFGQLGALAATKPGDKAMIQLLLDHGATLTSNPDRATIALRAGRSPDDMNLPEPIPEGPVTLAMQLEREDLALAILGRDKKIDSNDRLALVKATRKGWDKLALALLQMGADANAVDDDGISALAIATRKENEAIQRVLIAAGVMTTTPPAPFLFKGRTPFETLAGNEIGRSVHFDPPSFSLENTRQEQEQNPIVFYGEADNTGKLDNKSFNRLERVACKHSAGFQFLANDTLTGSIQIEACNSDIPRLRALATGAEPSIKRLIESLADPEITANLNNLKNMGWLYEKSMGKDGAEIYFFPVIAASHGALIYSTVLVIAPDNRRAVALQADTKNLCEKHRIHTPLCGNTKAALIDIAQHILLKSASLEVPEAKAP